MKFQHNFLLTLQKFQFQMLHNCLKKYPVTNQLALHFEFDVCIFLYRLNRVMMWNLIRRNPDEAENRRFHWWKFEPNQFNINIPTRSLRIRNATKLCSTSTKRLLSFSVIKQLFDPLEKSLKDPFTLPWNYWTIVHRPYEQLIKRRKNYCESGETRWMWEKYYLKQYNFIEIR